MGKRSIDYPAQDNPCNTLPPSERQDIRGVRTVYVCTLTYPLRFTSWGTREVFFRYVRARKRFRERNVRSEVRTRDLDDDKKCDEGATY